MGRVLRTAGVGSDPEILDDRHNRSVVVEEGHGLGDSFVGSRVLHLDSRSEYLVSLTVFVPGRRDQGSETRVGRASVDLNVDANSTFNVFPSDVCVFPQWWYTLGCRRVPKHQCPRGQCSRVSCTLSVNVGDSGFRPTCHRGGVDGVWGGVCEPVPERSVEVCRCRCLGGS